MVSSQKARAAALSAAALLFCAPAFAQAPISFLGSTPAQAGGEARSYAALTGGDANSYGYGAQRQSSDGVLDLRRTAARQADPDLNAPPQDPPDWMDDEAEAAPTAGGPVPLTPASAPAQTQSAAARPEWLATERVGPPYEVNGRWYAPTAEPAYSREGVASWYGPDFHGRQTASGETYDQSALTAAHPTLPLNSLVQVTNLENGREAILRVNDRGPFVEDRLIDVSQGAAESLGFAASGTARVHVRYLGPAPRRVAVGAPLTATPAPTAARQAVSYQASSGLSARAGMGAYVVQIGAFSSAANAERARARAAAAGPVEVEPRGALYRVRVGAFGSRAEAEAALDRLADLGFADAIVAAR